MKKYIIGTTACFVLLMFFVSAFVYRVEMANAIGSILRSGRDVPTGPLKMQTSVSTTTPDFIKAGLASSTLTFASENLDSVTVLAQVFASSTATNSWIQIQRYASDDNVEFYAYQVASTTNLLTFNPAKGATTTNSIDIALLPARYTRLTFGIGTTTSGVPSAKDEANIWVNLSGVIK